MACPARLQATAYVDVANSRILRRLHGCSQCDIVEFAEYQPVDHLLKSFDRYVACAFERRLDGKRVEDFTYEGPLGYSAACVDGAAQAAPCCHVYGHLFDFGDFGIPLITHQPGRGHSDAKALACFLNAVLYDAFERYMIELARLDPLVMVSFSMDTS